MNEVLKIRAKSYKPIKESFWRDLDTNTATIRNCIYSIAPCRPELDDFSKIFTSEKTAKWKRSIDKHKFDSTNQKEITEGSVFSKFLTIRIERCTLQIRSKMMDLIALSLTKNKGELMSLESKQRYFTIMTNFLGLNVKGCFAAYSTINKFVKTRLLMNNGRVMLNLTYYEERKADTISFSIEFDQDVIVAGSGNANDIAIKFKALIDKSIENGLSN